MRSLPSTILTDSTDLSLHPGNDIYFIKASVGITQITITLPLLPLDGYNCKITRLDLNNTIVQIISQPNQSINGVTGDIYYLRNSNTIIPYAKDTNWTIIDNNLSYSNILYSSSLAFSSTQPYQTIKNTSDNIISYFCLTTNPPLPTLFTVIANMSNTKNHTGIIQLKEANNLDIKATIIIPNNITTPTKFSTNISFSVESIFVITAKTSSSSNPVNIYSYVIS